MVPLFIFVEKSLLRCVFAPAASQLFVPCHMLDSFCSEVTLPTQRPRLTLYVMTQFCSQVSLVKGTVTIIVLSLRQSCLTTPLTFWVWWLGASLVSGSKLNPAVTSLLQDRSWTQSVVLTLLESVQRYNVRYPSVNRCYCCFRTTPARHHPRVCVWGVWARVWRRVRGVCVTEAAGRHQAAGAARVARPVGGRSQRRGWGCSWLVQEQLGGRGGGGGAVGQEAVEKQLVVVGGWSGSCCCHHHVVMLNKHKRAESVTFRGCIQIKTNTESSRRPAEWANHLKSQVH